MDRNEVKAAAMIGYCSACGKKLTTQRRGYCGQCEAEYNNSRTRTCPECKAPYSGRSGRCPACMKQYRQRRKEKSNWRHCLSCKRRLPKQWSYPRCPDCRQLSMEIGRRTGLLDLNFLEAEDEEE